MWFKQVLDFIAKAFDLPKSTVGTIIVTISVFCLGIIINQIIKYYEKSRERKLYRKLAKINWEDLKVNINKQAISLRQSIEQLNIHHQGGFNFTNHRIPEFEIILKIGYENLFKAYFLGFRNNIFFWRNKKRLRAFKNLWAIVEYMKLNHNDLRFNFEKFVEKFNGLNEERNIVLSKSQKFVESFRIKFNGRLRSDDPLGVFYNQREILIENYISKEENTAPKPTNDYVKALLTLNRSNTDLLSKYQDDINSVELNSLLLESEIRYENLNNWLISNNAFFTHIQSQYTSFVLSLEVEQKILKVF